MNWRPLRAAELETCLRVEPGNVGDELIGWPAALSAWKTLSKSPAFNSAVVETQTSDGTARIVGFGASAFVTPEFANAELANPTPGMMSRLIASVYHERAVVLDYDALSLANAQDSLDLFVLRGSCAADVTDPQEFHEAQMALAASFIEIHLGYSLQRVIGEPMLDVSIEMCERSGVWRRIGNSTIWAAQRRDITEEFNWPFSRLFYAHKPIFGFKRAEQELLSVALDWHTDEELAAALHLHVGSVKKRWASIIDRVAHIAPQIVEGEKVVETAHVRGRQKRHRVLAYVREHPEELRPFSPGVAAMDI